ncbi:hypothetical protein D3C72_121560 [compost metagenome]
MRRLALALGGLLSLGLVGCQDLNAFDSNQQKPRQGNPEVRWVSEPTEILDLQGPVTTQVGTPVELTVQVVIGSSSCNRVGEVFVDVDDAARKVTVRATRLTAQADEPIPCTDDYGWTAKKVDFTPAATGTYLVVAQGFKPGGLAPGDRQPQGELGIVVTAE